MQPGVHGWLAWKKEPSLGNSVKKKGLERAQKTMSMKKWVSKHLEHRSAQPSRNSGALKLTSLPKLQSTWDESSDSPEGLEHSGSGSRKELKIQTQTADSSAFK